MPTFKKQKQYSERKKTVFWPKKKYFVRNNKGEGAKRPSRSKSVSPLPQLGDFSIWGFRIMQSGAFSGKMITYSTQQMNKTRKQKSYHWTLQHALSNVEHRKRVCSSIIPHTASDLTHVGPLLSFSSCIIVWNIIQFGTDNTRPPNRVFLSKRLFPLWFRGRSWRHDKTWTDKSTNSV